MNSQSYLMEEIRETWFKLGGTLMVLMETVMA